MNPTQREKRDPKLKVVMVLTEGLVKRLDSIAEKKTMSRSLLIRQACERLLRDSEKEVAA